MSSEMRVFQRLEMSVFWQLEMTAGNKYLHSWPEDVVGLDASAESGTPVVTLADGAGEGEWVMVVVWCGRTVGCGSRARD